MSELKLGQMRIPDILETIADLSNDEVFTPPDLANKVLDMLPSEIWSNSKTTFLDPACKTGVFLREITKRLIVGLEDEIPDLQERVNHILTKQVYGLGITELTALMSRRTLYCATRANSEASVVTAFDNEEGNIKFPNSKHKFNEKTKKCTSCGAGEDLYHEIENRDNYAYSFLHDDLKEVFGDVKFDVIVGNPPYQLNVGNEGRNSAGANAIYHLFIDKALELNPKYLTMIIPSRWMTKSASGINDEWVEKMINSNRIKEIHDFADSEELFKSAKIRGGVNYFLWDNNYSGKCRFYQHTSSGETEVKEDFLNSRNLGVVIRDIRSHSILTKVIQKEGANLGGKNKNNFSSMVSPGKFFVSGKNLQSNWTGFSLKKESNYTIKYHMSSHMSGSKEGYVKEEDVLKNKDSIKLHKVYINSAGHNEKFGPVLAVPTYGEPNSVCSETYLIIGYSPKEHNFSKEECLNVISYIKTKFFRFMVDIKKSTQHCTRQVYQFVPLQDWSKPWTDAELYKKYKLTQEEIDYIEENIEEMK